MYHLSSTPKINNYIRVSVLPGFIKRGGGVLCLVVLVEKLAKRLGRVFVYRYGLGG